MEINQTPLNQEKVAKTIKEVPQDSLSPENIEAFSILFQQFSKEIIIPEGAIQEVNEELYKRIREQTYYHGTRASAADIKTSGFSFKSAEIRSSSRPLHALISGNRVFFTTDYSYAFEYAGNDTSKVIQIKLPTDVKVFMVNFRVMEKEVFPVILNRTQEILTTLFPQGFSQKALLNCANEAFNILLLSRGIQILTDDQDGYIISFIGNNGIPL